MRSKSKETKIKKLYKQLSKVEDQPLKRNRTHKGIVIETSSILTQRGRIENKIKTLQNQNEKS